MRGAQKKQTMDVICCNYRVCVVLKKNKMTTRGACTRMDSPHYAKQHTFYFFRIAWIDFWKKQKKHLILLFYQFGRILYRMDYIFKVLDANYVYWRGFRVLDLFWVNLMRLGPKIFGILAGPLDNLEFAIFSNIVIKNQKNRKTIPTAKFFRYRIPSFDLDKSQENPVYGLQMQRL